MSDHSGTDNVHTRRIAEFVATLSYERIPARGDRADQAADPRFARLRDLRRAARMVPHPADDARKPGRDPHHVGLGHAASSLFAARRAGQRHAGAGLRARRRSSPGRAARGRGHAARADRGRGEPCRPERTRLSHRRGRRLRDRPARRTVHGAGAYRPGLAFRRDGGRVTRPPPAPRAGLGLSAEKTVHALGIAGTQSAGPDGGAIRRHGQAHACRARVAERALRRAAREQRLHRHRRRVRGALWRLLHDVLALAGSLRSRRAQRRARRAVRDHGHRAQVLFLRRQQPHHARRHSRHSARGAPSRPPRSTRSWCTVRRSRSITSAGRTGPRA